MLRNRRYFSEIWIFDRPYYSRSNLWHHLPPHDFERCKSSLRYVIDAIKWVALLCIEILNHPRPHRELSFKGLQVAISSRGLNPKHGLGDAPPRLWVLRYEYVGAGLSAPSADISRAHQRVDMARLDQSSRWSQPVEAIELAVSSGLSARRSSANT